ncbi:MAG TPA: hypothetical protein VFI95_11430, partial [Terriglobales bacterium]|nr:hypothetical protein [Terriglobales bacterium]
SSSPIVVPITSPDTTNSMRRFRYSLKGPQNRLHQQIVQQGPKWVFHTGIGQRITVALVRSELVLQASSRWADFVSHLRRRFFVAPLVLKIANSVTVD